jgi:RND family efflux transporter MFP subunit
VPQYASSSVRIGQAVSVALKEFPGKVFTGKVARTAVALDPNSRTLRVEVQVPNNELTLAPGMYADVNFSVTRPNKMYLIPANSLLLRSEGPQVAIVKNGKTIHFQQVKLGEDLGKQIEVVGGLRSDDVIVVNTPDSLPEGATVATAR